MAKKQKKSHPNRPKRIKSKVYEAQKCNQFLKKVQFIAEASGALAAYKLIPKQQILNLLQTRIKAFRVEADPESTISSKLIHDLNQIVRESFAERMFPIVEDGAPITLEDWGFAGSVLRAYLVNLPDTAFEAASEVKKGFQAFLDWTWEKKMPDFYRMRFASVLGWALSEIRTRFFWFDYDFRDRHSNPPYAYECFILRTQPAEKKNFRIDGISRPAFRVGWPDGADALNWATIQPGALNIQNDLSDIPIDVYIQSHALLRLEERINCRIIPEIQLSLFLSIQEIRTKLMPNGQTLVEYRLGDIVVGYLVIQVVDGFALIRTFLFKTQSGTPEGDRLHQILGLQRVDIKYLEFDKLSTFVRTDVRENNTLISLFAQAGCDDLFKLFYKDDEAESVRKLAEKIAKYLNLEDDTPGFTDGTDESPEGI